MIVFDASTLILVAKIELLEIFLDSVRDAVAVPAEVERECCGSKKTFDALMICAALDKSRIRRRDVKNRRLLAKLQEDFSIGKGEAEAIALAIGEHAALVGIDDKSGINACKLLGIPFTTAIGILVRSREKGLLEAAEAVQKLESLARIGRYQSSIIEDAKQKLEA